MTQSRLIYLHFVSLVAPMRHTSPSGSFSHQSCPPRSVLSGFAALGPEATNAT